MNKCSNCDANLSEDSVFCANCGNPVENKASDTANSIGIEADAVKEEVKSEVAAVVDSVGDGIQGFIPPEVKDTQFTQGVDAASQVPDYQTMSSAPMVPPPIAGAQVQGGADFQMQQPLGGGVVGVKPKSGKGKIIAIILAVLIVAAAAVALIVLKPFGGAKTEKSAVIYMRDDGILKMIPQGKKNAVTITDDMASGDYYDNVGSIKLSKDQTSVAVIDRYRDLYIIPVSKMSTDEDHPSISEYKIDSDIKRIFQFDNSGKNLYYSNGDSELMRYNGKEATRVERDVARLIVLDNDDIIYMKGEINETYYASSAPSTVFHETMSKKKPEKTKISNDVLIYDLYINQGKSTKMYYLKSYSDATENEKDLYLYDLASKTEQSVAKRVSNFWDMHGENVIYSKETSDGYGDIHFYNGKEDIRVARDIYSIYKVSAEKSYIIYSQENKDDDEKIDIIYQTLQGQPQVITTIEINHYIEVTVNKDNLAFAIFTKSGYQDEYSSWFTGSEDDDDSKDSDKDDESKITFYKVSDRGVVGEGSVVDTEVDRMFFYSADNKLLYFKNINKDGTIGDLYSSDGTKTEEVGRDVGTTTMSMPYIGSEAIERAFYVKDLDSRRAYGDLTMYNGKEEILISSDIAVLEAGGSSFYNYQSDNEIYFIKDYSERRESGDLYVYRGKSKVDIVDYDVKYMMPSFIL